MYQGYDGSAALYGQDPRLAKLYRQRRFAEQLAAISADASPVQSPWQGVARIAQALIGNYEMARADRDADLIGEEKQAEKAKMAQQYAALIGGPPTLPPAAAAVAGQPAPAGGTVGSIHRVESGGSMQPGIYGDGGRSAGPMQVQEGALADVNRALGTNYTHGQLSADPELGKRVGEQYFEMLKARFGGDERKAAAAYNAGPGRVTAAIAAYGDNWEQGLPAATRENYLPRVFGQQGAQPTQQPAASAEIATYRQQAQQARAWAASAANNSDPRVQAMARNAMAMADHADQRANQLENRADQQAFQRQELAARQAFQQQESLQRQAEAERVRQENNQYRVKPPETVFQELTDKIASGTATPAEMMAYQAAAETWSRPQFNPSTGAMEAGRALPRAVYDALATVRGQTAPAGSGGAPNPMTRPEDVRISPSGAVSVTQPPSTTPQAMEDYRKAEVEASKVLSAADAFYEQLQQMGGTNWSTYLNNPRDPQAVKLNTLHDRLQEALRGEAFLNTGVLQPAEMKMLTDKLMDPRSWRGWLATNDAYKELRDTLRNTIEAALDTRAKLANIPRPERKREPPPPAGLPAPPPGYRWID